MLACQCNSYRIVEYLLLNFNEDIPLDINQQDEFGLLLPFSLCVNEYS